MSDVPVLTFDWKELPHVADNIWQAQMAGWERVLTYRGPLPEAESRGIRRQTMLYEVETGAASQRFRIPVLAGEDRDEYPFACTVEGAARSGDRQPWVGHVPRIENQVQGGMLRAFIIRHNITAAGPHRRFEVRVTNHPRGLVVR